MGKQTFEQSLEARISTENLSQTQIVSLVEQHLAERLEVSESLLPSEFACLARIARTYNMQEYVCMLASHRDYGENVTLLAIYNDAVAHAAIPPPHEPAFYHIAKRELILPKNFDPDVAAILDTHARDEFFLYMLGLGPSEEGRQLSEDRLQWGLERGLFTQDDYAAGLIAVLERTYQQGLTRLRRGERIEPKLLQSIAADPEFGPRLPAALQLGNLLRQGRDTAEQLARATALLALSLLYVQE